MPSYEIFDYGLRPAKSIERKLFAELLREIYGVNPGKDCTYIGLGSPFFIDFKIIHKELNIKNMINIEKKKGDIKRFEFNKPFSCINLKWGDTTSVLPSLNWQGRKIIWLDYDSSLRSYMFEDIDTIFSNIKSESFFLFSSNSTLPRYDNSQEEGLAKFKEDFEGKSPDGITKSDMTPKKSPYLIRKMIYDRIDYILSLRNAALQEDEHLVYHQLLNIIYKDGAPMITTGGYIIKKIIPSISQVQVNKLRYIRNEEDFLDLQSPIVTSQEIDLMNNYLPNFYSRFIKLKKINFIPQEEREKYFNTYRYHPNFVEIRE